jgi:Kef-type K+ transport system membrane component KefB/mannitol/fructose-specific phosphotransferase system IIA component (Ntr-type)
MGSLSQHDVTLLLVSLGLLLGAARLLGECAQRLHQPAVVGEILAGILLGPTVFGAIAPGWNAALFPSTGPGAVVLDGLTTLAITLFLLVAGMEVDLSTVWRRGGAAIRVGLWGVAVPFALGFALARLFPHALGQQPGADSLVFALFFATAVGISALPVAVRILMDLDLYRTDFGMVVVAACVLIDLVGWMVFALILGLAGVGEVDRLPLYVTLGLTVGFTALVLTVGRSLFHRMLPWLQAYTHWPGGVLGFAMTAALFGAAFTEWIGVHAILGSFMVGVAIGDSPHLREHTRMVIDQFVSFIFAPLFFASIGLRVNFAVNFDFGLVLAIVIVATVTKLAGGVLGARLAGIAAREAWAVGFALNARGAMEIILGLLALRVGLIHTRLFVALVVMALVTSIASGPMLQLLLRRRKPLSIVELLAQARFVRRLEGSTRREVIAELSNVACASTELDARTVEAAVLAREESMPTGVGHCVALPHARVAGITAPVVTLGLSEAGIDFDAPDGEPAHVLFLVLSPEDDDGAQLAIMASIARIFHDRAAVEQSLRAANFTEVLAALNLRSKTAASSASNALPLRPAAGADR